MTDGVDNQPVEEHGPDQDLLEAEAVIRLNGLARYELPPTVEYCVMCVGLTFLLPVYTYRNKSTANSTIDIYERKYVYIYCLCILTINASAKPNQAC